MFENFPYANLHQLNLDWVIELIQDLHDNAVLSVNGQTGEVILYQNATMQLPNVDDRSWTIIRNTHGVKRGIKFEQDGTAYIVSGNSLAPVFTPENPPTSSQVISDQYIRLTTLTGEQLHNWNIFRTLNDVSTGIEFDDNGEAYIISGSNRYRLYSTKNPITGGVSSVNGQTGNVVLYTDSNGELTLPGVTSQTADAWSIGRTVNGTDCRIYIYDDGQVIITAGSDEYRLVNSEELDNLEDEVTNLKSAIYTFGADNFLNIFESGGIRATDAGNVNTHTVIRTVGYIDPLCFRAIAKTGYKFLPFLFEQNGTYVGCLQTNGTIGKSSSTKYVTDYDFSNKTYKYRVNLKHLDDSDLTVSEYTGLAFQFITDPTFTELHKAADSKLTGDKFSEINERIANEFNAYASLPTLFYSNRDTCNLVGCTNLNTVFITNKNLLPVWKTTATNNGIERSYNNDGSLNLSGTSTAVATFTFTATNMPPISNGDFTLSIKNNSVFGNTDEDGYLQLEINSNYSTAHVCRFNRLNDYLSFHLSESEIVTGFRIRIASGISIPSGFKFYPQIEVGTTETDFVKNETKSFTPTTADTDDVSCFVGENYICAKGTMTGNVEFVIDLQHKFTESNKYISNLAGKTIVCFGDSITGNYPYPDDYPSMLADLTGATVYNAGFGGCCMADNHLVDTSQTRYLFTMCRLADSIVAGDFSAQRNSGISITYKQGNATINYVPERIATLENIDWTKVDYITIAYGTNDWNSNYPLDNENDPLDTTTYIGAFRYSIEKLLTAYPNLKILPITPLWRFWDSDTGMPSGQTGDYLDANTYAKGTGYYLWNYGDALIEASKDYHIPTLDIYRNCMMNKFNRHQYFNITDGTHPKYEGRKLFAEILAGTMESKY